MGLVAQHVERPAKFAENVLEDGLDGLEMPHVGQHDRELVAAQACDAIAVPDNIAEAPPDFLDQLVAGEMAEAIVDGLEAVEIEQQQRDATVVPGADERQIDAAVEARAVGEAGEHVVISEMMRLRLAGLELDMAARSCATRS